MEIFINNLAVIVTSLGLATLLIWFGLFKFTPTEANAIVDLVKNSPLTSWFYGLFSVSTTSKIIGIIEIVAGLGLVLGIFFPRISFIGSGLATIIFFTTCTFMLSSSGVLTKIDGLWVPSDLGSFLIKDLVAFGASLFLFGKSLNNF